MNENIYVVIRYIITITQAILTIYYFDKVLEDNNRNRFIYKVIFILILLGAFSKNLNAGRYGIIGYYIMMLLYVNFFKLKKDLFNLFRVVQFMTDCLAIHIVFIIIGAKISRQTYTEFFSVGGIYNIFILFIVLIVQILVVKSHIKEMVVIENFSQKRIIFFCIVFLIIQEILILESNELKVNAIINIEKCWLVCLLLSIIMFFYKILKFISSDAEENYRLQMQIKQNEFEERYINEVGKIYKDIQAWKHDYRNNINVIGNLALANRHDEMKEYILAVDDEITITDGLIYTGIFIVDSIITAKYIYANSKGIKFKVRSGKILKINISNFDLNIILSNLLDNAIEAAEKVENGYVSINIREKYDNIIINILNNTEGEIKIHNGQYISTKKEPMHGIGIYRVKETISKYDGHIYNNYKDNVFRCKVILNNIDISE